MAYYTTDLLGQLDGARMVVTEECELCEVIAIAYWNGEATVNYALVTSEDPPIEDVWTNYELKKKAPHTVEKIIRDQLIVDMCECS
jgi:hypothetical protein